MGETLGHWKVARLLARLSKDIANSVGNIPDRDIDRMMGELTDLNSLYTRLRRKRSKHKNHRVYQLSA